MTGSVLGSTVRRSPTVRVDVVIAHTEPLAEPLPHRRDLGHLDPDDVGQRVFNSPSHDCIIEISRTWASTIPLQSSTRLSRSSDDCQRRW